MIDDKFLEGMRRAADIVKDVADGLNDPRIDFKGSAHDTVLKTSEYLFSIADELTEANKREAQESQRGLRLG